MRRERGQPPKLDPGRRRTVLDAVASGATLAAAAAKAGVTRATVYNTRDRDPLFARDLAAARLRAAGRPVCPGCSAGELRFILAGPVAVVCETCGALYRLVPVTTHLTAVYDIAADLTASTVLADTA